MKKNYLLVMALAAMVSCSSDEFVGDSGSPNVVNGNGGEKAIQFTSDAPRITRTSETDAAKLNYKFKVFGVKTTGTGSSATDQRVFATSNSGVAPYDVWYAGASSLNTTASNSNNWEYVGATGTTHGTTGNEVTLTTEQTIKYWDYSASAYNFQAWSDVNTSGIIVPSAIDKNTMTITGTPAKLANFYISDLQTIVPSSSSSKVVTFTFRKAATKVRLGIYETIPGYVVKGVKFYYTTAGSETSSDDAILQGKFVGTSSGEATFNVTYSGTPQKAVLTPSGSSANTTYFNFGTFNSTSGIGTSSTNPTWASSDAEGHYIYVLPNTSSTNIADMTLKIDYTLYNDLSKETILVQGATATVPSTYMTWNPNYAYTYIFKISDNTNGSTGQSVVGLYPITFDAIVAVADDGTQETITTVSTPSITCYQEGVAISSGFDASKDIVVSVSEAAIITVKKLTDAFDYTKTYDQQSYDGTFGTSGTLTLTSSASTTATFANADITASTTYVIQAHTASADAYFVLTTGSAEVGPTP